MSSLWDDVARTIRQGVDTVVEKTEELTKIGKIKVDIINIKRNIEKNFTELGGRTYHIIAEENKTADMAKDKDLLELVECVKLLEKELEEKNQELEDVRKKSESSNGQASSEATTEVKEEAEAVAVTVTQAAEDVSAEEKPKTTPKKKTARSSGAKKTTPKPDKDTEA